HPEKLVICFYGNNSENASHAYYVVCVNASTLPSHKKEHKPSALKEIYLYGTSIENTTEIEAKVAGNTLCRTLTMTPPNALDPSQYRQKIKALAIERNWAWEEFDMPTLKTMGAGAFYAVGQGSNPQDAAIVRLSYMPKEAKKQIALVGKGICFDTGGHNLKPAKYMQNMHEDMNGSAVAIGILLAATQMQLPVKIDCWLAIAQNHISPLAYKQNDVVTALNGTSIEIVHTDAEGRMVLADTLTLASRQKPDLMIDFATLTGSMQTALGNRMSGIISNREALAQQAIQAGNAIGERVVAFPFAEDYDSDLDSHIADIKQCTMDSDADHILAARFLSKFIEHDTPWLHVDLASVNCKGGLGAVQSDVNGFGVALGLGILQKL
ncbi:MAG: leucyl aminopeptidase family protein, partial [Candidatus Nanopelagicaceae bacterium]|nr:leucyl aminopeptidase family protein [Candidatus Nanopelagicaceae bacterium]